MNIFETLQNVSERKTAPWKMFLHHKLLFLRLLSLVGSSFSLFKGVILLEVTREQSPRCSASPVAVGASSSVPQQTPGTGNPSRVNVWVWNWGNLANRLLTASCSSRLFLCSGGPSPVAADTLNSSMKPWNKMCRITRFCVKIQTFSRCVLLLLSQLFTQS